MAANANVPHPLWIKTGKAPCEHMFSALPLRADIAQRSRHVRFVPDSVAKVFLGERPKFFRTADGFRTWRYGGPHRFTQKRPRSLVWALRSIAVVQPAKSQLLRDFRRRSIFDFCNTICHKRTHVK